MKLQWEKPEELSSFEKQQSQQLQKSSVQQPQSLFQPHGLSTQQVAPNPQSQIQSQLQPQLRYPQQLQQPSQSSSVSSLKQNVNLDICFLNIFHLPIYFEIFSIRLLDMQVTKVLRYVIVLYIHNPSYMQNLVKIVCSNRQENVAKFNILFCKTFHLVH